MKTLIKSILIALFSLALIITMAPEWGPAIVYGQSDEAVATDKLVPEKVADKKEEAAETSAEITSVDETPAVTVNQSLPTMDKVAPETAETEKTTTAAASAETKEQVTTTTDKEVPETAETEKTTTAAASAETKEQVTTATDVKEQTKASAGAKKTPANTSENESVSANEAAASDDAVCRNTNTGTEYGSLTEAITAASAGDTIQVLTDHSIDSIVQMNKDLTLDLNGHTITFNVQHGIEVSGSANVTITDTDSGGRLYRGRIDQTPWEGMLHLDTSGEVILDGGVMIEAYTDYTISNFGGTLTVRDARVNNQNYSSIDMYGGTLNIEGGTVNGYYSAITAWPYKGAVTVNMTGGKVTGIFGAIDIRSMFTNAVTFNLSGGEISSDAGGRATTDVCATIYGTGSPTPTINISGDVLIEQKDGVKGAIELAHGSVNATGGVVVYKQSDIEEGIKAGDGVEISGGWFSTKVSDDYCEYSYKPTDALPDETPNSAAQYTVDPIAYNLYVGGVQVKGSNKDDVLGDGTVSYDPKTNTLSLNGANITAARRENNPDMNEYGIRSNLGDNGLYSIAGPLTINLSGSNTITGGSAQTDTPVMYGLFIASTENVTFTGDGSLDVKMSADSSGVEYHGIETHQPVTIDGVDISIDIDGEEKTVGYYDMYRNMVALTNGAKLTINAESTAADSYAFFLDSNNTTGLDKLSVEDGCVFEAISGNSAVKNILPTEDTIDLGVDVNTAATKDGRTAWDKTTDLSTFKYVRIPHEHNWGDWKVTKGATETAEGEEQRTCSICGETETRVIPKVEPTKTYTITYDPNGGVFRGSSSPTGITCEDGEVISLAEAPTRDGYTFLYWKEGEYQPGDSYTVTENHTFTAFWEKNAEEEETDSDGSDDQGNTDPDDGSQEQDNNNNGSDDQNNTDPDDSSQEQDNNNNGSDDQNNTVPDDSSQEQNANGNGSDDKNDTISGGGSSGNKTPAASTKNTNNNGSDNKNNTVSSGSSSGRNITAKASSGTSTKTTAKKMSTPKTGDETNQILWGLLLAASTAILLVMIGRRKSSPNTK